MNRADHRGGELPLIAWGEALRRRKAERRRLHRRGVAVAALIGAVTVMAALPPAPRLLWNASASAPIGLYLVRPGMAPRRDDLVVVPVPAGIRALAAERRYVPANVPLVKHVGAVPGDMVCAAGAAIMIDGRIVAKRRISDGHARPMPWWRGCRLLRQGDVFLLSPNVAAAFDGRYFGVSPAIDIVGIARPLWVR